MFKRYFLAGIAAGILSGLAAFFYDRIYTTAMEVNFTRLVSPAGIFSASLFTGMLIALCCFTIRACFKKEMEILTNILIAGITLLSMIIPFMVSLPLDMERPELFPGLVIPMQLFPALMWLVIKPLFL
ncbi:hypothetical protein [Chitinophaga pinensis]|uniref:Uncharacterized protein n=1 Tax=Chitinophaga pinensis TaxID=79329 RepID=A0A5C6LSI7_9BACT|nr:hypothetical protein [Chitinophaga pinensis]TWW00221.1 hypothetical protein FEF09_12860 [Chitinophaga pinensis]